MSDLAQRLREARDRMGISMEDAERATKIRRRYIEAIEAGDFGRLPDGPPARGFIKNYARYLGLDADQSLNDFETEVGVPITQLSEVIPPPPGRQQSVSRYTQLVKLPPGHQKPNAPVDGQPGINGNSIEDNGGVKTETSLDKTGRAVISRSEKQPLSNSFSLRTPEVTQAGDVRPFATGRPALSLRNLTNAYNPDTISKGHRFGSMSASSAPGNMRALLLPGAAILGLIAVVMLIGFVLIPALQKGSTQAAAPVATQAIKITIIGATPPVNNVAAPNFTPTAASSGGAITTTDTTAPAGIPAVTSTSVAPAGSTTVQPLTGGGVQLVLDARERAWVRVRVDGSVVYEGIPQIGPNTTWRGQNTVGVETGNAGAFDVIINSVRLGPAGARNATVNLSWDATGKPITN